MSKIKRSQIFIIIFAFLLCIAGGYVNAASVRGNAQSIRGETFSGTTVGEGYHGRYDGKAHTITVKPPESAVGAKITYAKTEGGTYTTDAPMFINVGSYVVYYKVTLNGKVIASGKGTVVIWDIKSIVVKYCGYNQTITQTKTEGGTFTPPVVTREGYLFKGWYTEETGGKKITGGEAFVPTQDMILYAHWEAVSDGKAEENAEAEIKSVKNTKANAVKVIIKPAKDAKKYVIECSSSKKFPTKKTVSVTIKADLKATISKTIRNLKKGKTYYVRVKAYRNAASKGEKTVVQVSRIKKVVIEK